MSNKPGPTSRAPRPIWLKKQLTNVVGLMAASALLVISTPGLAADATAWQCPVNPYSVTGYDFGEYISYMGKYHLADDANGGAGTPVRSVANAKIEKLYNFPGPYNYGGLILASSRNVDGSKVVSLYGHLDPYNFVVAEGQTVARGQLLGYLGDSSVNGGFVPHIHFGIRKGAYEQSGWVYYGYGSGAELANWEDPTTYIANRKDFVEVSRVPSQSPNRFTTAVGVSKRLFTDNKSADTVLLANGYTYVDALAATPLTDYLNGPLLLTNENEVPVETMTEIDRVLKDGGMVRLLGGGNAINSSITSYLRNRGLSVMRIGGKDRNETAALLGDQLGESTRAFIASNAGFADAVAAGGPALGLGAPLLLTDPNELSQTTEKFLRANPRIDRIFLLGGTAAVTRAVENQLDAIPNLNAIRIAGSNRYETSSKTARTFKKNPKKLVITTGANYPDALTGGSLWNKEDAALVLTKPNEIPEPIRGYMNETKTELNHAFIIGGPAAVDGSMDSTVAALLNSPVGVTSTTQPESTIQGQTVFDWDAAARQTIMNTSVPVPTGLALTKSEFRGASIAVVEPTSDLHEIPPPIVLTTIDKNGLDTDTVLSEWFSLTQDQLAIERTINDAKVLTELPGLFQTTTAFVDRGDQILIIETRIPNYASDSIISDIANSIE